MRDSGCHFSLFKRQGEKLCNFREQGPRFRRKMWGPYYMNTPPPADCFHPTRTVVIIDILLRTRAAMHTTIAAAAVWQFEVTQDRFLYALILFQYFGLLPCCKK